MLIKQTDTTRSISAEPIPVRQPDSLRDIPRVQEIVPSLSDMEPQAIDFLVDKFIPKNSVTLVTGDAGAGKSTLALAIAGAVSTGQNFADLRTRQAPVLYLDRENPLAVAYDRVIQQRIRTAPNCFHYWGL